MLMFLLGVSPVSAVSLLPAIKRVRTRAYKVRGTQALRGNGA